jgi:hypothetical protein
MVSLVRLRVVLSAPDLDVQAATLRTPKRDFLYLYTAFLRMAGISKISSSKEIQIHLLPAVAFLEIRSTSGVA